MAGRSLLKLAERAKSGKPYVVVQLKEELAALPVEEAYNKFNALLGIEKPDELIRTRAASLYNVARSNAKVYIEIEKGGSAYENRAPAVIGEGNHRDLTCRTRTGFVACFEAAEVWSLSSAIKHGDNVLFDFEDWEFAQLDDRLELDSRVFRSDGRDIWYMRRDAGKVGPKIDRAFALTGCHTRAFGHWMWEYLPKYVTALNVGVLPSMPILIDAGMPVQHRQALELFAPSGTDIIEIPLHGMVHVRELWCAAAPLYMSLHEKVNEKYRWDVYCSPPWRYKSAIEYMARMVDEVQPPVKEKRVYLARSKKSHRQLINALSIESIANEHGFEVVYPETLPFSEQIALLHSATAVVGPEGSAMFLTFFSRRGTKLAILSHPDVEGMATFTAIVEELGIEAVVITGPFHERNEIWPQFSSYTIDEHKFQSFLRKWLSASIVGIERNV
jgi:hypothetical protein